MANTRPPLTRGVVWGILCGAVLAPSLVALPAWAAEAQLVSFGPASHLAAKDLVALAERFDKYADKLPGAEQLGMKKVLAFEEGKHFVAIRGSGSDLQRRVVFCKPDTFVVEDLLAKEGGPSVWGIHRVDKAALADGRARIREGDTYLTVQVLWPMRLTMGTTILGLDGGRGPSREIAAIAGIEPKKGRFVYVVHVGKPKVAPPKASLVEKNGALTVTAKAGGQTFTVTFPADAAEAGTIAVQQADGKVALAQRLLPAGIMPHGAKGVRMLAGWDAAYRGARRAPWDSGRPAMELAASIKSGALKPGRAVVLGCGSGTNAIYLAQKGFDVTAIDVAPTALSMARAKADKAKVKVQWLLADVLAPPALGAFDVIFDRGCYHGVRRVSAAGYAKTVAALSKPGTHMLILAGNANEPRHYGPPRVDEPDLVKDFAAEWDFVWLKEMRMGATDPNAKTGPWSWSVLLRRRAAKK